MGRPPKPRQPLSAAGVLAHMSPGVAYRVGDIARAFSSSCGDIRRLLNEMARYGEVKRCKAPDNSWGFRLPPVVEPRENVAGPAYRAPNPGAVISGYEAELRKRVALCMSIRRAA